MTPRSKLHFIDHPRYGKVYPLITHDFSKNYFKLPVAAFMGHGLINTIVLYSTMINKIFTPVLSGFVSNPLFIIPSLYLNYALFDSYYAYVFGARSHVQNVYLKPSGKEVIIETRDGMSHNIMNEIFFSPKKIESSYESRIDIGYGANKYLYIKGNPNIYDLEIL